FAHKMNGADNGRAPTSDWRTATRRSARRSPTACGLSPGWGARLGNLFPRAVRDRGDHGARRDRRWRRKPPSLARMRSALTEAGRDVREQDSVGSPCWSARLTYRGFDAPDLEITEGGPVDSLETVREIANVIVERHRATEHQ